MNALDGADTEAASQGESARGPSSWSTVFLDIDEVLCVGQAEVCLSLSRTFGRGEVPSQEQLATLFSAEARGALADAYRRSGGVRYVISSTWREHLSREQMTLVLGGAELQFVADNLHEGDAWRCLPKRVYRERRAEVLHWLETHHQGEPFVVLDDLHSADQLIQAHQAPDSPLFGRVVLCTPGAGLTTGHVDDIVNALQRPAGLVHRVDGGTNA